jgi:hypothetical protein
MQKISSYLYPNRLELLINSMDLDYQYPVEWKIVYQRPIKIYKGVDNAIELVVKNNDQKRINISDKNIKMIVKDQSNYLVGEFTAEIMDDGSTEKTRGLAKIVIDENTIKDLDTQFLNFSVVALDDQNKKTLLYADSNFSAKHTLDLLDSIVGDEKEIRRYDTFQPETNYQGRTVEDRTVSYYSSAIPVKDYAAVPTTSTTITVYVKDFVGTITIQSTQRPVIGHESFLDGDIQTQEFNQTHNTPVVFSDIDVTDLAYLRVKYIASSGTVDYCTVES